MTIRDFFHLMRAHILLILLLTLLGVGVSAAYLWAQPVRYLATSTGIVVAGTSENIGESTAGMGLAQKKAVAYSALINTEGVGERMAKSLKSTQSPLVLAGSLTAYAVPDSVLLKVAARASTGAEAAKLADAGMEALAAEALWLEGIGQTAGSSSASVVQLVPTQDAPIPTFPYTPDWQLGLPIGAAAGFLLGYVAAMIRSLIDRRVRKIQDVETATGKSALAVIPRTGELLRQRAGGEPGGGAADEALRQLRTNLRFASTEGVPRSLVVTSCVPGEGKSTVASNLARVFAEAGEPTILIDADLRRPVQHRTFGVDGSVGLSQALTKQIALEDALIQTETENLRLLPAGPVPPNPSELVGSERMAEFIAQLSVNNLVIIDAPPLLPVTDAGLLAAQSAGAILVVRVNKTYVEQLELARKTLEQVQARLFGVVVNMAPLRSMGTVVYGAGMGGYKQQYSYQSKPTTEETRAPLEVPAGEPGTPFIPGLVEPPRPAQTGAVVSSGEPATWPDADTPWPEASESVEPGPRRLRH